jgi:hypothetical protein
VQGARSGLLPVAYLDNGQDSYTNCIGLFAAYDQQANQPIVDGNAAGANTSLASFGYNVRKGWAVCGALQRARARVCCGRGHFGGSTCLLRRSSRVSSRCAAGCLPGGSCCSARLAHRGGVPVPAQCDTLINQIEETWKVRVSIIVYAMAVVATLGWLLFMVFGGIGLVALPIDWIRQFIRRPRATITRSQYIDRARELARRAKDILGLADALKREERERGRSWRWRRNTKALHNQLLVLEEDEAQLELVYPQARDSGCLCVCVCVCWVCASGGSGVSAEGAGRAGWRGPAAAWMLAALRPRPSQPLPAPPPAVQSEDPDYKWVLTVLGFWFMLFGGLLGLALSICWVLQIILYVLIDPPVTPLLNEVFIK